MTYADMLSALRSNGRPLRIPEDPASGNLSSHYHIRRIGHLQAGWIMEEQFSTAEDRKERPMGTVFEIRRYILKYFVIG